MIILSVIDSNKAYGKERANLQVMRVLRENGAEVVLAINSIADESISEEARLFEKEYISYPRNISGSFSTLRYLWAYILTQFQFSWLLYQKRPDYILIPTEIAFSYLFFPLILCKAKIVFRCGDSPLVCRKHGVMASVYSRIWRYFIVNRIDTIVCNAKFLQLQNKLAGRKSNSNDKLIYNYPPHREVSEDSIEYREVNGGLRIGFIGRIVADKGVRQLIEAGISLLHKEHNVLIYIGGGLDETDHYKKELEQVLNSAPEFKDKFHFLGVVKDLQKFYHHVDIVAIPSIYPEPMANVVTEAKAFHKPVIIFNQGGMPEIVEHKKTGYICQNVSVECLVEGIKYYLENPGQLKEHGDNAYRSIEELGLTKDIFTKKWLNVFK